MEWRKLYSNRKIESMADRENNKAEMKIWKSRTRFSIQVRDSNGKWTGKRTKIACALVEWGQIIKKKKGEIKDDQYLGGGAKVREERGSW
jgi:hypothetical protein